MQPQTVRLPEGAWQETSTLNLSGQRRCPASVLASNPAACAREQAAHLTSEVCCWYGSCRGRRELQLPTAASPDNQTANQRLSLLLFEKTSLLHAPA